MSIQTIATQHTRIAQTAKGGYAKGELVHHGGVVWKSMVANNLTVPGTSAQWEMVS